MPAEPLALTDDDRATLESWARSRVLRASQVERARIVLAAADGTGTSQIADDVGVSRPTVIKWRERFIARGLDGLDDHPRSGRPKRFDEAAIVEATLQPPPASTVPRWSSRLLARHLGVSDATVSRAWRKYHVRPEGAGSLRVDALPRVDVRAHAIVGLHIGPSVRALVVDAHAASRVDRVPARRAGSSTAVAERRKVVGRLIDEIEAVVEKVSAVHDCSAGTSELLDFLDQQARDYPQRELHVLLDQRGQNHDDGTSHLLSDPWITIHRVPRSGSWLSTVEILSRLSMQQPDPARRTCLAELTDAIAAFLGRATPNPSRFDWSAPSLARPVASVNVN